MTRNSSWKIASPTSISPHLLAIASVLLSACGRTYDVGHDNVSAGGSQGADASAGSGGTSNADAGPTRPLAFPCEQWGTGDTLAANGKDLAVKLVQLFWGGGDDDAVTRYAAALQGGKNGDLYCVVLNMLGDFRATAGVSSFYRGWLDAGKAPAKDEKRFPGYDAQRLDGMATATNQFAVDVTLNPNRRFRDLFTSSRPMEITPEWGGVTPGKQKIVRYAAGLLVEPGILSLHGTGDVAPAERSLWFLDHFLCQEVPPPPANMGTLAGASPRQAMETFRDFYERVTAVDPACAGCHHLINPPGLALDQFDAVGRLRPFDSAGLPFDEAYVWPNFGTEWKFETLTELGKVMADLQGKPQVEGCFARHWASFLSAGAVTWPTNAKEVLSAVAAMDHQDGRIPHLLAQIAVLLFGGATPPLPVP